MKPFTRTPAARNTRILTYLVAVSAAALGFAPFTAVGSASTSGATPSVTEATTQDPFVVQRPALVNPLTIKLTTGESNLVLSDTRDYILKMPGAKKTGTLTINGGRNVVVIGGYMSVKVNGAANIVVADRPTSRAGRVVHLEGILIDSSSGAESDGLRIKAPKAIVQLKNMRIVNLKGSKDSTHADLIQPWDGVGQLRVDGLTGSSRYNGLYLRRENDPLGPKIGPVWLHRVNIIGLTTTAGTKTWSTLRAISIGTQSVPATDDDRPINCELTDPVHLGEFYAVPPAGTRLGQFVVPHDRMVTAGCPGRTSADGRSLDWPALRGADEPGVTGVVRLGPPPGGDFVPAGTAGLNYRAATSP
jgi:hypothetical protein